MRKPPPKFTRRTVLVVAAVVAAAVLVAAAMWPARSHADPPRRVPISEVVSAARDRRLVSVTLQEDGGEVKATYRDHTEVRSTAPAPYIGALTETLTSRGVRVKTDPDPGSSPWQALLRLVLILLVVGMLYWVVKKMAPDRVLAGAGRHTHTADIPDVSFADVAGLDEVVDELTELVTALRHPERFRRVGATPPAGVLLTGPPGTGKTLLARAIAGEARVPFYALSGSDFTEVYVGVGASRVRRLFGEARRAGRAIVFIDELDAVGRARGAPHPGTEEREGTLNALLVELDGFAARDGVMILGATNRPEILDTALLRPGRFDRRITIGNPDRSARERILAVHASGKPLGTDVAFDALARRTAGFSGADLESLVNQAAIAAARRDSADITAADFDEALSRVMLGPERRSSVVTDADRRVTAWHEAGHTLVAALLPDAPDPVSVTIVPRGPAGGATWMDGHDSNFSTRNQCAAAIAVALGGRAAEELALGDDVTQGAAGDLAEATHLATEMVTRYGLGPKGAIHPVGELVGAHDDIYAQVCEVLDAAMTTARTVLAENRPALERLVAALDEHETLDATQIATAVSEPAA